MTTLLHYEPIQCARHSKWIGFNNHQYWVCLFQFSGGNDSEVDSLFLSIQATHQRLSKLSSYQDDRLNQALSIVLEIFSKNQLLVSSSFSTVIMLSVSLISSVISFLLPLNKVLCYFPGCFWAGILDNWFQNFNLSNICISISLLPLL